MHSRKLSLRVRRDFQLKEISLNARRSKMIIASGLKLLRIVRLSGFRHNEFASGVEFASGSDARLWGSNG